MTRIGILNGPNLNLLGKREPEIYGTETFESYLDKLREFFPDIEFQYYQTNVEGELINKLHEWGFVHDGIILNAGGYTHTSVSIGDAITSIDTPVIEVHISHILAREEFRNINYVSRACKGTIMGFGYNSYKLGTIALLDHLEKK